MGDPVVAKSAVDDDAVAPLDVRRNGRCGPDGDEETHAEADEVFEQCDDGGCADAKTRDGNRRVRRGQEHPAVGRMQRVGGPVALAMLFEV
jgi:hypothetical protein